MAFEMSNTRCIKHVLGSDLCSELAVEFVETTYTVVIATFVFPSGNELDHLIHFALQIAASQD
jgi:hypothetical protein